MEENQKLICNSTEVSHQKKYKFNPIGHHPRSQAAFDENQTGFTTRNMPLSRKNHQRQSKTRKPIHGQNQQAHKQRVNPIQNGQPKDTFQKKRINNIYRWSISQLLDYIPPPNHVKENLLPISNPSCKKRIDYLLQLYQNKFHMRKHYCLTMSKIFEETIHKIDQEMHFIHRIIKQTEGSTFKAQQMHGRTQKSKRKFSKAISKPPPPTPEVQEEKDDDAIKITEGIKLEDILIKKQPSASPDDTIVDVTNTMRFLGLSPTNTDNKHFTDSEKA